MVLSGDPAKFADLLFGVFFHYNYHHYCFNSVCITGRVARAGRSGTAYSLVAMDEVAHLVDLHMFLGRPLTPVPQSPQPPGKHHSLSCRLFGCLATHCYDCIPLITFRTANENFLFLP